MSLHRCLLFGLIPYAVAIWRVYPGRLAVPSELFQEASNCVTTINYISSSGKYHSGGGSNFLCEILSEGTSFRLQPTSQLNQNGLAGILLLWDSKSAAADFLVLRC